MAQSADGEGRSAGSRQARREVRLRAAAARDELLERKRETRRQILVGQIVLGEARADGSGTAWRELVRKLNPLLARPTDRELFGLAPKPKKTAREN